MMTCPKTGKKQFADIHAAKNAITSLKAMLHYKAKQSGIKLKNEKIRPYICPECSCWHMGRGARGSDAAWKTRKIFLSA